MNPPLAFADAQDQLAIITSQTGNFTFNSDEMTQSLQVAWNDDFNCVVIWDNSISYVATTWQYPIPVGVDIVRDLYYQKSTTDKPERLSPSMYEIVDGNIQFNPTADRWLMTGMTIFIKSLQKLTTDDNLPTTQLINYVLYTAALDLLNKLILKQAFVFLRNDISMSDISRAIGIIQSAQLHHKQALLREFESG